MTLTLKCYPPLLPACVRNVAMYGLIGLCLPHASNAATFNLNLSGRLADASTGSFDSGASRLDCWILDLTGLDASNAITVSNGDSINVTITLDKIAMIPPSGTMTSFGLTLTGVAFPAVYAVTSGSTSFFSEGVAGPSASANTGGYGSLFNAPYFVPPANGAIAFDSVLSTLSIDMLSIPATLDFAYIDYQLTSPIPDLPQAASIALGLAFLTRVVRRGKSH